MTENDIIAEYVKKNHPGLLVSFNFALFRISKSVANMVDRIAEAFSKVEIPDIEVPEIDLDKVAKEKQEKQAEELDKWDKLWIYLNDWRMGVAPDESTPEEDRERLKVIADTISEVMESMVEFENEEDEAEDGTEEIPE